MPRFISAKCVIQPAICLALLALLPGSVFAENRLVVLSPVAGDAFPQDLLTIKWEAPGAIGNVTINLRDGDGIAKKIAEVPASDGTFTCFLKNHEKFADAEIFEVYDATGTYRLTDSVSIWTASSNYRIEISGTAGLDSYGFNDGQYAESGAFAILRPTATLLSPSAPQILKIGQVFRLRWTTTGHPAWMQVQTSTNGGKTWIPDVEVQGFWTGYPNTGFADFRIKQAENSSNFALWDLANVTDDPREVLLPFLEELALGKPLMIRFRAGLYGGSTEAATLIVSTDGATPARVRIRGIVGKRLKKVMRWIDGRPRRIGKLPRGLKFRPKIRGVIGRPRQAGRKVATFVDQRGFKTIATIVIRDKKKTVGAPEGVAR